MFTYFFKAALHREDLDSESDSWRIKRMFFAMVTRWLFFTDSSSGNKSHSQIKMKNVCLVSQVCRNVHDQYKMSYEIWEVHNFSRRFSREKNFTICIFCLPKGIWNASEYYFPSVLERNCEVKAWSTLCFKFL